MKGNTILSGFGDDFLHLAGAPEQAIDEIAHQGDLCLLTPKVWHKQHQELQATAC